MVLLFIYFAVLIDYHIHVTCFYLYMVLHGTSNTKSRYDNAFFGFFCEV